MKYLITQTIGLRILKRLGSSVKYIRPNHNEMHDVSLVVFEDAGRVGSHGRLVYISGLLIDYISEGSILHTISWWSSHKGKRPVNSIEAAEVLASSEGIYDGKLLPKTYVVFLFSSFPLLLLHTGKPTFDFNGSEPIFSHRLLRSF